MWASRLDLRVEQLPGCSMNWKQSELVEQLERRFDSCRVSGCKAQTPRFLRNRREMNNDQQQSAIWLEQAPCENKMSGNKHYVLFKHKSLAVTMQPRGCLENLHAPSPRGRETVKLLYFCGEMSCYKKSARKISLPSFYYVKIKYTEATFTQGEWSNAGRGARRGCAISYLEDAQTSAAGSPGNPHGVALSCAGV